MSGTQIQILGFYLLPQLLLVGIFYLQDYIVSDFLDDTEPV